MSAGERGRYPQQQQQQRTDRERERRHRKQERTHLRSLSKCFFGFNRAMLVSAYTYHMQRRRLRARGTGRGGAGGGGRVGGGSGVYAESPRSRPSWQNKHSLHAVLLNRSMQLTRHRNRSTCTHVGPLRTRQANPRRQTAIPRRIPASCICAPPSALHIPLDDQVQINIGSTDD